MLGTRICSSSDQEIVPVANKNGAKVQTSDCNPQPEHGSGRRVARDHGVVDVRLRLELAPTVWSVGFVVHRWPGEEGGGWGHPCILWA